MTDVLGADHATLHLLDDIAKQLVSRAVVGKSVQTIRVPAGKGIAGVVARTGKPMRVTIGFPALSRVLALACVLGLAVSGAGCSSPSDGCQQSGLDINPSVSLTAPDGTPVCDAYITSPTGSTFCTWRGCTCETGGPGGWGDVVISRRGYEVLVAVVPMPITQSPCDPLPPPTKFVLTPSTTTDACVPRDSHFCPNHRTCYAASPPGCTTTAETSSDPGSSYVCCGP